MRTDNGLSGDTFEDSGAAPPNRLGCGRSDMYLENRSRKASNTCLENLLNIEEFDESAKSISTPREFSTDDIVIIRTGYGFCSNRWRVFPPVWPTSLRVACSIRRSDDRYETCNMLRSKLILKLSRLYFGLLLAVMFKFLLQYESGAHVGPSSFGTGYLRMRISPTRLVIF